jgi:hypothetical protein
MNNIEFNKVIEDAKALAHDVRLRDIAYVFLSTHFDDKDIAYASVFGNSSDVDVSVYNNKPSIQYLKDILFIQKSGNNAKKSNEDISFEENKAYMLKLKKDTEDAMKAGEIDKKDGLKILTDISTKLNDKFQVSSEEKDQVIFVNQKYNDICPRCSVEISRRPISKEEAIKLYNLVEKN